MRSLILVAALSLAAPVITHAADDGYTVAEKRRWINLARKVDEEREIYNYLISPKVIKELPKNDKDKEIMLKGIKVGYTMTLWKVINQIRIDEHIAGGLSSLEIQEYLIREIAARRDSPLTIPKKNLIGEDNIHK